MNERAWLIRDVLRALEAAAAAGDAAGAGESKEAEMEPEAEAARAKWHVVMLARLVVVAENLEAYAAHKVRTWWHEKYKEEKLKEMTWRQWFDLRDYWGKLKPSKFMNAVCEQTQAGISVHGSMIIFRNPTKAQRSEVTAEYSDFEGWAEFPDAADDGGPEFLCVHMHVIADDAKQNSFHLQSVLELQYTKLKKALPWLSGGGFVQSDGASNYHCMESIIADRDIGDITGMKVLEHIFTAAGEGKGEGDSEGGRKMQGLRRFQDREQADLECATEIYKGLESERSQGEVNILMVTKRKNQVSLSGDGKAKGTPPPPGQKSMLLFKFPQDSDKDVIMMEVRKVGQGKRLSKEELASCDRQKGKAAAPQCAEETAVVVPKQRKTADDRQKHRRRKSTNQLANEAKRQKRHAATCAAKAAAKPGDQTHSCPHCDQSLQSATALARHCKNDCTARVRRKRERVRGQQTIESELRQIDEIADAEEKEEIAALARVRVAFTAPNCGLLFEKESTDAEGAVTRESTWPVVSGMTAGGAAAKSLQLDPGYTVAQVDGILVENEAAFDRLLAKTTSATPAVVTFQRPPPPFPVHGWARKALRKKSVKAFLPEQKAFLEECFNKGANGEGRIRDKQAWQLMKTKFGGRMTADLRPLCLRQGQIRGWFSRRCAALKRLAVQAALHNRAAEGASDEEEDDDEARVACFGLCFAAGTKCDPSL